MPTGRNAETISAAYSLLADSRRRFVLYHFLASDLGSIEDLGREIAAVEADAPVESAPEEIRTDVIASLRHNHLPRLESHGVVEYDGRSGDVVRADGFEEIRPIVEQSRAVETDASEAERNRPVG